MVHYYVGFVLTCLTHMVCGLTCLIYCDFFFPCKYKGSTDWIWDAEGNKWCGIVRCSAVLEYKRQWIFWKNQDQRPLMLLMKTLAHCINLIFEWDENYKDVIVCAEILYTVWAEFFVWLKKMYGMNCVGWNKYMGWNMWLKNISAKLRGLKKYRYSIMWAKKLYEQKWMGWKNGPK